MEKRNQLDAFEEFILDEVNEHKMYPSGRVWDNIRTEVHGKRSWPALTIIALTLMALWKHRIQAIDFAQTPTKLGS